jgi:hypothetical protein
MPVITSSFNKNVALQCDARNCTRKIEHYDLETVRIIANSSNWIEISDFWYCPRCSGQEVQFLTKPQTVKSKTL